MASSTAKTPSLHARSSAPTSSCLLFLVMVAFHAMCASGHMMPRSAMLPPGSTEFIKSIFRGRCHDYIDCTLPHNFQCGNDPSRFDVNCTESLHDFLDAFSRLDPCNVPDDAYDHLLKDAMIYSQEDETLFWSGTREIAVNIATVTTRYTTIERTLAGYILNGLQWCGRAAGTPTSDDMSCPLCPYGTFDATYQFWRSASRHFAAQARGSVSLLLDSTRKGGAFQNASTFATQELPNINSEQVTHVNIHLVRNVALPPETPEEDCDTGSILVLRSLIEEKGLNYTCTEDDSEFILIQCVNYPDTEPCKRYYNSSPVLCSASSLATMLFVVALNRIIKSMS